MRVLLAECLTCFVSPIKKTNREHKKYFEIQKKNISKFIRVVQTSYDRNSQRSAQSLAHTLWHLRADLIDYKITRSVIYESHCYGMDTSDSQFVVDIHHRILKEGIPTFVFKVTVGQGNILRFIFSISGRACSSS